MAGAVTTTLWRLLLGSALVVAGLLVVRDPETARSLVAVRRGRDPPPPEADPASDRRRSLDADGRARAAGGFLFLVGVTLLLGGDLP